MLTGIWVFITALFILAASCYLLFITSDNLEKVGGRLGRLLHLPDDVIASTLQALATSGPEIVMAIIVATPYISSEVWQGLQHSEKACSGCLNMCFSAMHNLVGIGCLGILFMIGRKTAKPDEVIVVTPSVKIGLIFYILSSGCLSFFVMDGIMTEIEAWVLMIIGIVFVLSQFIIPALFSGFWNKNAQATPIQKKESETGNKREEPPLPTTTGGWSIDFLKNIFIYAFLVFALVVFVRECISSTFNMATVGIVSVGGVLIMFTSYVSSFPEFMMTYRYAVANKKSSLLGMLFGSNVVDLAFAGFRPIWLHEPMEVITTGRYHQLLPLYIWVIPLLAILFLAGLCFGKVKYKHAYPLVVFYVIYIVSGFILL